MNFTPLFDYVVLKQIEQTHSAGGIFLGASSVRKNDAEVMAVGPGVWSNGKLVETTVKVGDIVHFLPANLIDVTIEGEKYILCKEASIAGIVKRA